MTHDLSTETMMTKYSLRGAAQGGTELLLGSLLMTAVGAGVSASGTIAAGNDARESADRAAETTRVAGIMSAQERASEAQQAEQNALTTRATSQRGAMDKRREGDLLGSTLQARAAASGGGAADRTIQTLGGGIAGRTEEQVLRKIYEGDIASMHFLDQAAASRRASEAAIWESQGKASALRFEGESRQRGSRTAALGTVLGAGGSMFGTVYGGKRDADLVAKLGKIDR